MTDALTDRKALGARVAERLNEEADRLRAEFDQPGRIRSFVVDDLLDADVAQAMYEAFPPVETMMRRRSIREDKFVATQMDRYAPLLEEALFAFQQPVVVDAVAKITGIPALLPDERLYAGGISAMVNDQYLNPHIDNSHDEQRQHYRVLNLLYYATPGWRREHGGNLQLWDQGRRRPARSIDARFNRLVVMATSTRSWHGVDRIVGAGIRTCLSNYYFAPRPISPEGRPVERDYFHVTTFRGFPDQPARNAVLVADGLARAGVRKVFRRGVTATKQVYQRR
jgi:Rps23 Pro-64 3,4-dihydroxylase Tpa1-like proline 4-hydroxylase